MLTRAPRCGDTSPLMAHGGGAVAPHALGSADAEEEELDMADQACSMYSQSPVKW
jgi:hypothetical protein